MEQLRVMDDEALLDSGGSGVDPAPDDAALSLDVASIWEAVDGGLFGGSEDFAWCSQDALDESHGFGEEPFHAPERDIPLRRRVLRGAGRRLADYFDDPRARNAFLFIYEHVRNCLLVGAEDKVRRASLDWVFTFTEDSGLTFTDCCRAIDVRPHVIQLRIHYQWYLSARKLDQPFSFFLVPVPAALEGELLYRGGEEAVRLASRAWKNPGVEAIATSPEEQRLLWQLEERGLLGESGGGWYLIGRNPEKINYKGRGWAALW